jgi:RNA polymerase sigma-70 factor (ECF subfamily)
MSAADFTNLYEELAPEIRRYVGARVSGGLSDDLTAQVFADAWAGRYRFDSELGAERAWLFGIARNHLRRHFRSKMRQDRAFARNSDYDLIMPNSDVSDRIDAEVARPELFSALRQLRAVDRELFLLHAVGGLTYAELAHVTGAPIGTIRSRLSRTRSRLRSELQSLGANFTDGVQKSGGPPVGEMFGDPSAFDPC